MSPAGARFVSPASDPHHTGATAFTAVILGIETLEVNPAFSNFTKELCVLTDGESEINWDGLENAATQMNMKGISLSVM